MAKKKKNDKKSEKKGRYSAEVGDYEGNAILRIKDGEKDRFPFSFGLTKAKKIVAVIPAIEKFVADQLTALAKQAKKQKKGAKVKA